MPEYRRKNGHYERVGEGDGLERGRGADREGKKIMVRAMAVMVSRLIFIFFSLLILFLYHFECLNVECLYKPLPFSHLMLMQTDVRTQTGGSIRVNIYLCV